MAAYLDILIDGGIWNFRTIGYSTMQYAMFLVMRDIRGKSARSWPTLLHGAARRRGTRPSRATIASALHGMNR